MFRTKRLGLTFDELFSGSRMTLNRATGYYFKYTDQAIDCGYVEHKKQELTNNSGTYNKPVDPKITQKMTLIYPIRYIHGSNFTRYYTDITSRKNSSAD